MSYFNAKMLQNRFLPQHMLGEHTALPPDLPAIDLRVPISILIREVRGKRDLADQQKILSPPLLLVVIKDVVLGTRTRTRQNRSRPIV